MEEVRNGHAEIAGEDARHLTRVLRVEPGQRYEISDNRSVYLAEIETARKERVIFRTLEKLDSPAPSTEIILCAALIKFDRLEWMIEKATELGVAEVIPFVAARSERGLERAAAKRIERWRKIALEASQQSRRAHLPRVSEPRGFEEALAIDAAYRFVLDEEPGGAPLVSLAPERAGSAAILIGPEGGWTDAERESIQAAGWTRVSLGNLILRAETAAVAALAIVGSFDLRWYTNKLHWQID